MDGVTDKMVTLVRGDSDQYTCETGLMDLSEVANGVKLLPRDWINEDGISMNFPFYKYANPLIQGEVTVPYDNGLPAFAKVAQVRVSRLLEPYNAG